MPHALQLPCLLTGIWRQSHVAVKISSGVSTSRPLGFARHSEGDVPVQHAILHEAMIGMSLRHANLVPTYCTCAVPPNDDNCNQPDLYLVMGKLENWEGCHCPGA